MERYKKLNEDYLRLYNELENDNFEVKKEVIELEEKIEEECVISQGKEKLELIKLLNKVKNMKKEFEFYNQEAILDMMFPDRYDQGFDEDSMSYDSVFGDD